jgi:hypothetical protein
MPISVTCTCGRTLSFGDGLAGKRSRCPYCLAMIQVPAALTPVPASPSSRPPAPASILIPCPHCSRPGNVPPAFLGRTIRCKHCGERFSVEVTATPVRRRRVGVFLPIASGMVIGLAIVAWLFRGRPEIQAVRDAAVAIASPKDTPDAQGVTPAAPASTQPKAQPLAPAPVAPTPPANAGPSTPLADAEAIQRIVREYVLKYANDPKSIEFIEWSEPAQESRYVDDFAYRPCDAKIMATVRGRNALGGSSVSQAIYYLHEGRVVYSHKPDLQHQMTPNYQLRYQFAPQFFDPSVGPLTPEQVEKRAASGVAP